MKDKIIVMKAGIDLNSLEFKEYYQRLKQLGVRTFYLDNAMTRSQEVLTTPIIFNDDEYNEYKIDDIAFLWIDEKIIGHQVLEMTKMVGKVHLGHNFGDHLDKEYIKKPGYRRKVSSLEYYCDIKIDVPVYQYYKARTSGKLESEFAIPYEKQNKIKK